MDLSVYLHSNFSGGCCETHLFRKCACQTTNRSLSFKVIYYGTNQKCLCDFLVVRHSNLSDMLQVFCITHLFNPSSGVFPLDQIADVGVCLSIYLKLISRKVIFEVL